MGGERNARAMNGFDSLPSMWIWASIQVAGLLTACVARLSEGTPRQTATQGVFFACLALVGVSAVIALLAMGPGFWLTSATALAIMIFTVTCDFRSSGQMVSQ
jgi:CHASE2 domain-containing sensor protein